MRDNITKVAERGERLDQLQDKTGTFLSRLPVVTAPVQSPPSRSASQRISFHLSTAIDNLAISAQGFRRGADRVRKVCAQIYLFYLTLICSPRICGKHRV